LFIEYGESVLADFGLKQTNVLNRFVLPLSLILSFPTCLIANDSQLALNGITSIAQNQPSVLPKLKSSLQSKYKVDLLCRKIANKLGSVHRSDCKNSGFDYAGGESVRGLPIIMKEFPPLNGRDPISKILVIGGIHGDEYSSVSIVFKWIKILNQHHSGLFNWKMVPLMNPDGLLRKKSQRMNDRGVDLNRNFPTPNWRVESHKYWIHRTKRNPRRYPGPAPLSEPESRWLASFIDDFKPDVIVSVHAPYGILDFDGPNSAPNKFGKLKLNLLGTYPGSLGNYAGKHQSLPVVTVELPYAGIMPTPAEVSNIWRDLVRWLRQNANENVRQANKKRLETQQSRALTYSDN